MKEPQTIKGWLSQINMLRSIGVSSLKGFDKMEEDKQGDLLELSAMMDNVLNEWEKP